MKLEGAGPPINLVGCNHHASTHERLGGVTVMHIAGGGRDGYNAAL